MSKSSMHRKETNLTEEKVLTHLFEKSLKSRSTQMQKFPIVVSAPESKYVIHFLQRKPNTGSTAVQHNSWSMKPTRNQRLFPWYSSTTVTGQNCTDKMVRTRW